MIEHEYNRRSEEISKWMSIINCLPGRSSSKMVPVATDGTPITTFGESGSDLRTTSKDSSISGSVSFTMVTVKTVLFSPLSNVMF